MQKQYNETMLNNKTIQPMFIKCYEVQNTPALETISFRYFHNDAVDKELQNLSDNNHTNLRGWERPTSGSSDLHGSAPHVSHPPLETGRIPRESCSNSNGKSTFCPILSKSHGQFQVKRKRRILWSAWGYTKWMYKEIKNAGQYFNLLQSHRAR